MDLTGKIEESLTNISDTTGRVSILEVDFVEEGPDEWLFAEDSLIGSSKTGKRGDNFDF